MTDDIRKIYGDARFVLRNDSLENWQTENPVLLEGELSYVTDGEDGKKIKFGDGITPWNDLAYFSSGTDVEVDQTYNPTSENAQSGKAVAEAVEEIDTKANTLDKRVTNLEQGFAYFPFETDSTVAHQKIVPANALSYAEITKVGGMTYRDGDILRSAPVTEVESVGKNLFDKDFASSLISWSDVGGGYAAFSVFVGKGTKVTVSYQQDLVTGMDCPYTMISLDGSASGGYWLYHKTNSGLIGKKYTFTSTGDYIYIRANVYNDETCAKFMQYIGNDLQIELGDTATEYSPHREPISFPIPEEVQALDGYGWGVNDTCYNYIDFEKKQFVKRVGCVDMGTLEWNYALFDNTFYSRIGDMALPVTEEDRKTGFVCENYSPSKNGYQGDLSDKSIIREEDGIFFIRDSAFDDVDIFYFSLNGVMLYYELAEPIITDISNLITDDNFIEVEGNGMLTFKNEYEYAVPSEITYQIKEVVAE